MSTEVNCEFNLLLKTDYSEDRSKFKNILDRSEPCDFHFISEVSQYLLTQSEKHEERRYDS